MTSSSSEPLLPEENASLTPARRRRQRRVIVSPDAGERAELLAELSRKAVPSFEFFLYSLLSGLLVGLAFLLDAPALVFLAALLAPFMAPIIGVSLGTVSGAFSFFLQSTGSLAIGSLMVFLGSLAGGWVVQFMPDQVFQQAQLQSQFTWASFLVLILGAGIATYQMVRSPEQKPVAASVAIAYGLYLPLGAAGFGLSSGTVGPWPDGLILYIVHLLWACLVSILVLAAMGLRPHNAVGYFLATSCAVIAALAIAAVQIAAWPPEIAVVTPTSTQTAETTPAQVSPSPTLTASLTATPTNTPVPDTATPTPTRTLVPSRTPTKTLSPVPTPVWARIFTDVGNGALIREEPDYNAVIVQSLLNGSLVEVLPDRSISGNSTWVRVRTIEGNEGWIVQSLLRTATPVPDF